MRYNIAFISSDTRQAERLQAALSADCAVLTVDPRKEDRDIAIRNLAPHAIVMDMRAPMGASSVVDRMTALRRQFADRPLIALGDEMSAQLILASFRAGVDDFLDGEASDGQIRDSIMARLRERAATAGPTGLASLVSVLSPAVSEEDCDLALNIAAVIAQAGNDRRVLLLDLSLPASPARTALGLDFNFTVNAAIREMARLDRTFLDSALARDKLTGLQVLPLSDGDGKGEPPAIKDLSLLLQILRANFDTLIVYWGPFSAQAVRAGADADHLIVCCNQRFSSVRNAKTFITELRSRQAVEPVLAIHQFDTGLVPSPEEIQSATGASSTLVLRASWQTLAMAHNRGRPLVLGEPNAYGHVLRTRLAADGLLPRQEMSNSTARLLHWLRRATG
jgi:pilus assembly protein CpaE